MDNRSIVKAYYKGLNDKNIKAMEPLIHPEVEFIGPLAVMTGRDALLDAAHNLTHVFDSITMRAVCESDEYVMAAYTLECPEPIGPYPGASLVTIKDGLITRLELFYDARIMEKNKDAIFTKAN